MTIRAPFGDHNGIPWLGSVDHRSPYAMNEPATTTHPHVIQPVYQKLALIVLGHLQGAILPALL